MRAIACCAAARRWSAPAPEGPGRRAPPRGASIGAAGWVAAKQPPR